MDQTYIRGKFQIPPNFDFNILPNREKKVCVVSIIGKTDIVYSSVKGIQIEGQLKKNIFSSFDIGAPASNPMNFSKHGSENAYIDGYYDNKNQVIYLSTHSIADSKRLIEFCDLTTSMKSEDFIHLINQEEFHYIKIVFYLFHISHIIMVSNPGYTLDSSYIRFFQFIDTMRNKLHNQMNSILRTLAVSRDWSSYGRPCTPRILFLFNMMPSSLTDQLKKQPDKLIKLQHNLEDKIYNIFKRTRLISDNPSECLFSIPSNHEFVHVSLADLPTSRFDLAQHYLDLIINNNTVVTPNGDQQQEFNSFYQFLRVHLELALSGKGFDDNPNRHGISVFDLPPCKAWFKVCHKLFTATLTDQADMNLRNNFQLFESNWNVNASFSDSRCKKALPLAEKKYREDLPVHYPRSYHLSRICSARRVFLSHARGIHVTKSLNQLEERCERIWLLGRQMCPALSITGQQCRHEVHKLPESNNSDNDDISLSQEASMTNPSSRRGSHDESSRPSLPASEDNLTETPHRSGCVLMSACSCGKMQSNRDDPFDWKEANYTFYKDLSRLCCDKYPHMNLLLTDKGDRGNGVTSTVMAPDGDPSPQRHLSLKVSSESNQMQSWDHEYSLEQTKSEFSSCKDEDEDDAELEDDQELNTGSLIEVPSACNIAPIEGNSEDDLNLLENKDDENQTVQKCVYFMGMLTDRTPEYHLPKLNSWCLLNIGKYYSYSHATGIEQSGFRQGSNFLLPWDVQVRSRKWLTSNEFLKKSKAKGRVKDPLNSFTVKIFIGFEYECPLGHRFFLAGPHRMMKGAMQANQVKEAVQGLLNENMPLYFPCDCSKGYLSQLMRIFVAVPNSPVHVSLKLAVKAAHNSPLFLASSQESILLSPGNLWIARLPFAYQDGDTIYRMPGDAQLLEECYLLNGSLSYLEIDDADDCSASRE